MPSLDGLRAISIGVVLAAHFIDSELFPGGLGVYIFFVISGFLITRLLLLEHKTTGGVSIPAFYLRRVLRLYPVIVTFSACILGLYLALGRPIDLIEPASALAYFANYLYVHFEIHDINAIMPFGIFWSLSVEEHFYILFPLVFILLGARPARLLPVLAGVCAACLGLRLIVATLHPDLVSTQAFYTESQYRIDSIAYGVILALACETAAGQRLFQMLARPIAALSALLVILATLAIRDPWFRETIRYSMQGAAIVVLVAAVLFSDRLRPVQWVLNTPPLVWVGRLSYSLYVWHEGVASLLPTSGLPHWQVAAINIGATFAVASVSFYCVEQPFLRLRHHLPRLRPGAGKTHLNHPHAPAVHPAHTQQPALSSGAIRPGHERLPANSGA